jgi:uncharacterized protein DUF6545
MALFYLPVLAAISAALAFWIGSYRQTRKAGVRAMCWALALLDLGLALGIFGDALLALTYDFLPAIPQFVQHIAVLTSAYWLQVFCLHLTTSDHAAAAATRRRAVALLVALVGLLVFYILGPLRLGLPSAASTLGDRPWVTQYLAVYSGYLGWAMVDVMLMSRLANKVPRRNLRLGLRLLGAGSIFGLLYVAHRIGVSVATAFGVRPPWPEYGPTGVSSWLIIIAIVLLMAGVMVPPFGARWDARRAHTELGPLWTMLTDSAPNLVYPGPRADQLRVRTTEIRDVLIGPLSPYLSPEIVSRVHDQATALNTPDPQAVGEAAAIAVAVEAKRRDQAPLTTSPAQIAADDDLDQLVRISQALDSPLVDAAIQEFVNSHDHIH